MKTKIKIKPCPNCVGGFVPEDPDVPLDDLRAEIREKLTSGPGRKAFDERVERITRERAGR